MSRQLKPFGAEPKTRTEDWSEAHRALYRLLKNRARGERDALTQPRLVEALRRESYDVTRRSIFYLVRDLVLTGYPVGTSGKGVFWCVSREEVLKARQYLTSRFDDLRARVEALDAILGRWQSRPHAVAGHPAGEQGALFADAGAGSRT